MSLVAIGSALSVLTSCSDEVGNVHNPAEQLEIDKQLIKEYVDKNHTDAVLHDDTGIWYEILEEGDTTSYKYKIDTVAKRLVYPTATVLYKGMLLNGTTFDQSKDDKGNAFAINPSGIIQAWVIAFFPEKIGSQEVGGLTKKGLTVGSKIRIFTPSYYAYGPRANGSIPANSPLVFEIEVLDITDSTIKD